MSNVGLFALFVFFNGGILKLLLSDTEHLIMLSMCPQQTGSNTQVTLSGSKVSSIERFYYTEHLIVVPMCPQ